MSISEINNLEIKLNSIHSLENPSQGHQNYFNDFYTASIYRLSLPNISYRNSATNTSSDSSYESSKCLSFPIELMISHPFSNETENLNYYCENDCCNSLCKNRQRPYLHLDTISKLKLKNFVQSIYNDKRNSKLLKPTICPNWEDASTSASGIKSRKKRRKTKKKKCSCKKDSSVISFYLNSPKGANAKKNCCCCKRKKKRRARNDETIERPHSSTNLKGISQDKSPAIDNEAKSISLTLGNQKIVISFEGKSDVGSNVNKEVPNSDRKSEVIDEGSQWQSYPSSRSRANNKDPTYKTRSRSSSRNKANTHKKCECFENLMKLLSSEINNCNKCCESRKKSQSKIDNYTSHYSNMSESSFEMGEQEDEMQTNFRKPQTSSFGNEPGCCCGSRNKGKSKQNISTSTYSEDYSGCKKFCISVNSNPPETNYKFEEKSGSCCCKNCSKVDKIRNSSSGPPVEYVYLQEAQNAVGISGSSSMNSRSCELKHGDDCDCLKNIKTANKIIFNDGYDNCCQFHLKQRQGLFSQRNSSENEKTTTCETTEFLSKVSEKRTYNKESKGETLTSTTESEHIPLDAKSEGTSISQTSGSTSVKNESCLCNDRNECEAKIEKNDYDYPACPLFHELFESDEEQKYIIYKRNESADCEEEERYRRNLMKHWFKSIIKPSKISRNSEGLTNELLRNRREEGNPQRYNMNTKVKTIKRKISSITLLKNAKALTNSNCDELEQLLLEIENYWQMNSSNSNMFENQKKSTSGGKRKANDCFIESINDVLNAPIVWRIANNETTAEVFKQYLDSKSKIKLLTNFNKSEYGLPKKTSGKVSDLKLHRKMRIKSLIKRSKIINENYIGFFLL